MRKKDGMNCRTPFKLSAMCKKVKKRAHTFGSCCRCLQHNWINVHHVTVSIQLCCGHKCVHCGSTMRWKNGGRSRELQDGGIGSRWDDGGGSVSCMDSVCLVLTEYHVKDTNPCYLIYTKIRESTLQRLELPSMLGKASWWAQLGRIAVPKEYLRVQAEGWLRGC